MAICEACGREMNTADGCGCTHIKVGKRFRKRIPVGFPGDLFYGHYSDAPTEERVKMRCPDCNALFGEYHHAGCDAEACPKCKEQLLSCDCDVGRLGYFKEE